MSRLFKRGDLPPGYMIDHAWNRNILGLGLFQWKNLRPRRWWHLRDPKPRYAWILVSWKGAPNEVNTHLLVLSARLNERITSGTEVSEGTD